MTPNKMAEILKRLGDAHYQAADELIALAGDAPVEALPFEDEPPAEETPAEGSLAQCPKHRKAYVEGNYGPYCTSTSDDPAWSNAKGYCRITPKNAAQWLRMHAA